MCRVNRRRRLSGSERWTVGEAERGDEQDYYWMRRALALAQLKDDPNPLVGLLTELTAQVFKALRSDLERLVVGLGDEQSIRREK